LEEVRAQFPRLEFVLARPISFDYALADAVIEMAARARPPERWRDDMLAAPRYCIARAECPLYGTLACPHTAPEARPL
jgi:hypothetical protein